jgi:hypothetical protein
VYIFIPLQYRNICNIHVSRFVCESKLWCYM